MAETPKAAPGAKRVEAGPRSGCAEMGKDAVIPIADIRTSLLDQLILLRIAGQATRAC